MKQVIIYQITFPNGKSYIGQTTQSLSRRLSSHKSSYKNKDCRIYGVPLYNAMRKYGWDSLEFEIITRVSEDCANEKESHYIEKYGTHIKKNGYNCILEQPRGKREVSEETRSKLSLAHRTSKKHKNQLKRLHKSFKINGYPKDKRCACYTMNGILVKEFSSLTEAAKDGYTAPSISNCCANRQKTHRNLTWRYI